MYLFRYFLLEDVLILTVRSIKGTQLLYSIREVGIIMRVTDAEEDSIASRIRNKRRKRNHNQTRRRILANQRQDDEDEENNSYEY